MFTTSTLSIFWMFGKVHFIASKSRKFNNFEAYFCGRQWHLLWLAKMLVSWQWLLALWVSLTRIIDNRHFPADTLGGIILGFACGLAGFKSQYGMNFAHSWRLLEESNVQTTAMRFGQSAVKHVAADVELKSSSPRGTISMAANFPKDDDDEDEDECAKKKSSSSKGNLTKYE